ncbi:MAG: hypothetical protein BWY28_03164 [bacterium ADurb.Bin236]|nr:MAG: hypothetical protein BWY28_03164 [bacterium ADurb.Bin236]
MDVHDDEFGAVNGNRFKAFLCGRGFAADEHPHAVEHLAEHVPKEKGVVHDNGALVAQGVELLVHVARLDIKPVDAAFFQFLYVRAGEKCVRGDDDAAGCVLDVFGHSHSGNDVLDPRPDGFHVRFFFSAVRLHIAAPVADCQYNTSLLSRRSRLDKREVHLDFPVHNAERDGERGDFSLI